MLVISRRVNEPIFIGDDIKIVLTLIEPGRARVGIKAPKHLKIRREEDDGYQNKERLENLTPPDYEL